MTKVSVIVPVYNAEKYLKVCLDSLVNQTLDDIEIIVIDDASEDNSLEIIKDYALKYSFIKAYYNDKNIGQSETRNRGISLSSGKYIGFLDADDYVSLTMYKTMYDAALDNNFPDIITTRLKIVSDNSYYSKEYTSDLKGRYLKIENNPEMIIYESPSCCNKLFKSDLIKNYGFIPNVMWEDVAFTYSCFIKADDVLMMNNLDYFYRRDIKSGVSSKNYVVNSHVFDIIGVAYKIEREAKKCNKYAIFKKQIKFLQVATCLQRIIEIENWQIEDKQSIKEKLYYMILENFGNLDDVDKALLSMRVDMDVIEEFDKFCRVGKKLSL